jgi:hypothetical protein
MYSELSTGELTLNALFQLELDPSAVTAHAARTTISSILAIFTGTKSAMNVHEASPASLNG